MVQRPHARPSTTRCAIVSTHTALYVAERRATLGKNRRVRVARHKLEAVALAEELERVVVHDPPDQALWMRRRRISRMKSGTAVGLDGPQSPAELTISRSGPYISIMSAARCGVHLVTG